MRAASGRRRSLGGRLLVFAAVPAVASMTPLLALPGVTSVAGAVGWSAVAIGQSVGAAGAVITDLGWGLTGTVRVGRQGDRSARRLLAWSFATKGAAAIGVLPLIVVVAWGVAPAHRAESATIAACATVSSVNAVWWFIGRGHPGRLLLLDAVPRATSGLVAAALLFAGWPLWVFVVGVGFPALLAPFLAFHAVGLSRADFRGMSARRVLRIVFLQRTALAGRAVSSVYIALPVALVALVAPVAVVSGFAAADRLQRMVLTGLQAVPNTVQHWVGSATDLSARLRRAVVAAFAAGLVGVCVGGLFVLLAPGASRIVFSGTVPLHTGDAALCAALIAVVSSSRIVGGVVLVVLRRVPQVLASAVAGACVGVVAIPCGAVLWGTTGALGGMLASEVAVLWVQVAATRRSWSS